MIEDCVIKRNGQKENNSFDKILSRVKKLGDNDLSVNYTSLAQQRASLITTRGLW